MSAAQSLDQDPCCLFRWYRKELCPGVKTGAYTSRFWKGVYGCLTNYQKEYNSIRPCLGLKFMRLRSYARSRCQHPLCPSCWHRKATSFLRAADSLRPDMCTYIRSTSLYRWSETIPPEVIKRFKARSHRYQLIGYFLNYDACDTQVTPEIAEGDAFNGELSYQLVGIFQSENPVKDKNLRYGAVQVLGSDKQVLGSISRVETSPSSTASLLLEQLRHPWVYRGHGELFDQYLRHFHPRVGKSWAWVNSHRLNKQHSAAEE